MGIGFVGEIGPFHYLSNPPCDKNLCEVLAVSLKVAPPGLWWAELVGRDILG